MSLFHYPKTKHTRTLKPAKFKNYRTYKRYLQTEFVRLCVYCRQPDSSAPNLNYGADHYRPKGVAKFASLVNDYENLFYCCGNCNSRKNNYWPKDEKKDPWIVNPCDFVMAAEMRFNASTGEIETRGKHGDHTQKLLQLNDPASVQYRLGTIRTVKLLDAEIKAQNLALLDVEKWFSQGKISVAVRDAEKKLIEDEIAVLTHTRDAQTGQLSLPPLRKKRLGKTVLSP